MDLKNDDDYWTVAKPIHYNFDDEEDEELLEESLAVFRDASGGIFGSSADETNTISLNLLLSKSALEMIVDDDCFGKQANSAPPVEETIKKMYHGRKYCLHDYKSLDEKLALLEGALSTYDGLVILAVFNYLRSTLKPSLFYYHVTTKKVALKQYANYLIINKKLNELEDFYMATGNVACMCEVYHISCKEITSRQALIKILESKANLITNPYRKANITQYNNFTKQLMQNKKNHKSVIAQLAALIKEELENKRNLEEKVYSFKKTFNVDEFQFEWTLLNVLCALGLWLKLVDYFVKPNWLTKKNSLKSVIKPQLFIATVHKHGGPKSCLEDLLSYVNDSKEALELAEKFKCYKYVVNCFVSNKDRNALLSFKNKFPEHSEEALFVETALLNLDNNYHKRRSLGNLLK